MTDISKRSVHASSIQNLNEQGAILYGVSEDYLKIKKFSQTIAAAWKILSESWRDKAFDAISMACLKANDLDKAVYAQHYSKKICRENDLKPIVLAYLNAKNFKKAVELIRQ